MNYFLYKIIWNFAQKNNQNKLFVDFFFKSRNEIFQNSQLIRPHSWWRLMVVDVSIWRRPSRAIDKYGDNIPDTRTFDGLDGNGGLFQNIPPFLLKYYSKLDGIGGQWAFKRERLRISFIDLNIDLRIFFNYIFCI